MMRATAIVLSLALAACSGEEFQDLKQFVKESGQGMRGRVDPPPEVKPYEPFVYNAFDLPDPFKPRKIDPAKGGSGGLQPDFNRPREALESYPLESLKMVGTLQQSKLIYALIKAPDNNLYRVKIGNYVGQNFGIVSDINESSVTLKEIVQGSANEWTERTASLQLLDEQEQKK